MLLFLEEEMSYENAKIVMLPIDSITPHPNNPRKEPDELDELLDYEDYWENNQHWGEPTEEG